MGPAGTETAQWGHPFLPGTVQVAPSTADCQDRVWPRVHTRPLRYDAPLSTTTRHRDELITLLTLVSCPLRRQGRDHSDPCPPPPPSRSGPREDPSPCLHSSLVTGGSWPLDLEYRGVEGDSWGRRVCLGPRPVGPRGAGPVVLRSQLTTESGRTPYQHPFPGGEGPGVRSVDLLPGVLDGPHRWTGSWVGSIPCGVPRHTPEKSYCDINRVNGWRKYEKKLNFTFNLKRRPNVRQLP